MDGLYPNKLQLYNASKQCFFLFSSYRRWGWFGVKLVAPFVLEPQLKISDRLAMLKNAIILHIRWENDMLST